MKWITLLMFVFAEVVIAGELPVIIKGMDDGVKTNKQQDFKEAVMNAKLQAIEQSGTEISAITRVDNFQVKYDMIESKSEGILLPDFQIMDIGYQTDGTYLIILSGKIKTGGIAGSDPSEMYNKAALLTKQEKWEEALVLIDEILQKHAGSEYALRAYDLKWEVENKIGSEHWQKIGYKEIFSKFPNMREALRDEINIILYDREEHCHRVQLSIYYRWDKRRNLGFIDDYCQYTFSVFIDGRLIGEKSNEWGIAPAKEIYKILEVFDDQTGLTISFQFFQRELKIFGGIIKE